MASALESRPYIGTWNDNTKLVQWTPDALVKINGKSTLPGCPQCKGVIRIQDHLTEVSADAGTEPGSMSCSITLSFPKHIGDLIMREGSPTLRPGLEVETFMRGYFPVAGLFDDTSEGVEAGVDTSQPTTQQSDTSNGKAKYSADAGTNRTAAAAANRIETADQLISIMTPKPTQAAQIAIKEAFSILTDPTTGYGYTPAFAMAAILQAKKESGWNPKKLNTNPKTGQVVAIGFFQLNRIGTSIGGSRPYFKDGRVAGTEQEAKDHPDKYYNAQDLKINLERWVASLERSPGMSRAAYNFNLSPAEQFKRIFTSPLGAGDPEGREKLKEGDGERKINQLNERERVGASLFGGVTWGMVTGTWTPIDGSGAFMGPPAPTDPTLSSSATVTEGLPNVLSYPYYPVFHGVVTEVTPSYSGGYVSVTLACSGLLHFWEYQRISTSASIFGERAPNSFLNTTLVGNHYNGMHPYAIIYDLWSNAMGAQDGVGWVLEQQTNQSTTSGITEDSLFSLMGKYWKERFGDRFAKLRMHGFTGDLFTSAQAAFLAGQSSDSLSDLIKSRYPIAGQSPNDVTSKSQGLGLFKGRKLESLVVAKNLSDEVRPVELDMGQMVSFVQSISDMGTVNFFESAYQSKLDIVNTVCGLTGYEFYQDVDGDFVFKPPMYNLDTSSSRVYCIEDIDIINISFPEGEAVATTARVKGGHFENLMTGAVEGEWGVSGTFINYPLVAQFGWRPLELETSYLTNPRAMFFYAASQLDLKNAASTRVSITIPQRPEIRPGFPVYVRFMDCFYYINSLSHSISFGGDCTTTLQGLAKRAKFNAPGNDTGGIDLADTTLPEQILREQDTETKEYRNVGFPNVIMTLDPYAIDPLFLLVGSDIDNLSDPQTLQNLFEYAVTLNMVSRVAGGYRSRPSAMGGTDIFYQVESSTPTPGGTSSGAANITVNVQEAANKYALDRNAAIVNKKEANKKVLELESKVGSLRQQYLRVTEQGARDKLNLEINAANDAYQKALRESLAISTTSVNSNDSSLVQLKELLGRMSAKVKEKNKSKNLSGAALYLDLLSDKKASFTNGSIPGKYRYYSASHPSKEHQGPVNITVNGGATTFAPNLISPDWDGKPIDTFNSGFTQKVPRTPSAGITIVTGKSTFPNGETMPTSEIKELAFAKVGVKTQTLTPNITQVPTVTDISNDLEKSLNEEGGANNKTKWFSTLHDPWKDAEVGDTAYSYFLDAANRKAASPDPWLTDWEDFVDRVQYAWKASGTIIPFGNFTLPKNTQPEIAVAVTLLNQQFNAQHANTTLNEGGDWIRGEAMRQFRRNRNLWLEAMSASGGLTAVQIATYSGNFDTAILDEFDITNPTSANVVVTSVQRTVKTEDIQVPVFPVSDERGYRVVGMYRYGRGVSIDPNGVWDSLAAQDPLSVLDAETLQALLTTYVQNQSKDAKLELEVLRQLRAANITDADLLNLGLAVTRAGGKTEIGLSNWLTTGKEGIDRLPVNNMAKSLGDIDQKVKGSVPCSCLSMTGFLALENENVKEGDSTSLTTALQRITKDKVPHWRASQRAYRGQ